MSLQRFEFPICREGRRATLVIFAASRADAQTRVDRLLEKLRQADTQTPGAARMPTLSYREEQP